MPGPEGLRWKPPTYTVGKNGKVVGYVNRDINNWGKWGDDDQRGATNFITGEAVVKAAGLVKKGKVFSLGIPIDNTVPSLRSPAMKFMTVSSTDSILGDPTASDMPGFQANDDFLMMPVQGATNWDGLAHFAWEDVMYNGYWAGEVTVRSGLVHLGIQHLRSTLIGRGVLLDIARYKGVERLMPGMPVSNMDLDGCAKKEGVEIRQGDLLLVRTGHMEHWYKLPQDQKMAALRAGEPGMGVSSLPFLQEKKVAAVALDNLMAEVTPFEEPRTRPYPFHVQAVRNLGLLIGELFKLDELAADCAQDGAYEFFLSAAPLNITNAVGGMVNPIAIK